MEIDQELDRVKDSARDHRFYHLRVGLVGILGLALVTMHRLSCNDNLDRDIYFSLVYFTFAVIFAFILYEILLARRSCMGKHFFVDKNNVVSILVQPLSMFSTSRNIFINVSAGCKDVEFFTNYPDTEHSVLLKQPPSKIIDKLAYKAVHNNTAISGRFIGRIREPYAFTIVFPRGLELNSVFGPLHVYCVNIDEKDFESMKMRLRQNERHLTDSHFGRKLLTLSKTSEITNT